MRSMSFLRVSLTALLAIFLLSTVTAFAKDGRDFVGFYNVSHPIPQGDHMRVTLNLQVRNFSSADVKQAVVMLRQNTGLDLVGQSAPIKVLHDHGSVKVSQRFTVSRAEYELWQQGTQPTVFLVYKDARGHQLDRYIQLAPSHGF
jgi:hypothetical protein